MLATLLGSRAAGVRAEPRDDKARVDAGNSREPRPTLEAATERAAAGRRDYATAPTQLIPARRTCSMRRRGAGSRSPRRPPARPTGELDAANGRAGRGRPRASTPPPPRSTRPAARSPSSSPRPTRAAASLAINSILAVRIADELRDRARLPRPGRRRQQQALDELTVARGEAEGSARTPPRPPAKRAEAAAPRRRSARDETAGRRRRRRAGRRRRRELVDQRQQAVRVANAERGAVLARYERAAGRERPDRGRAARRGRPGRRRRQRGR